MGGIGFILVVALYVFIAYKIVEAMERKWVKVLVIVAALLIPTADAIYGRIKLRNMCEAEAGLKIYRIAEHVEGFMDATFTSGDGFWVKDYGYGFSEYAPVNGLVVRYARQNGLVTKEEKVLPKSQYRVRYIWTGDVFVRTEYRVETISGLDLLASYTGYAFHGGWAERLLARLSDAGVANVATCDSDLSHVGIYEYVQVVTNSLKH